MVLQSKTVSSEATSPNLTILSQIRPGQSCMHALVAVLHCEYSPRVPLPVWFHLEAKLFCRENQCFKWRQLG